MIEWAVRQTNIRNNTRKGIEDQLFLCFQRIQTHMLTCTQYIHTWTPEMFIMVSEIFWRIKMSLPCRYQQGLGKQPSKTGVLRLCSPISRRVIWVMVSDKPVGFWVRWTTIVSYSHMGTASGTWDYEFIGGNRRQELRKGFSCEDLRDSREHRIWRS